MSKGDYLLIAVIFILVGLIACICADSWRNNYNNHKELERMEELISVQNEKIERQNMMIDILIRERAMKGAYDKK